uniref:Uncharacterized protein n=1 Tax=Anguilla anguilla TaxID=7936 RepID=A0A0E9S9W9_ANGAN
MSVRLGFKSLHGLKQNSNSLHWLAG